MASRIEIWLRAFRLRTLPLATASIFLGSFLAAAEGAFRWKIAGLCLLTAILLQILSNLANDYGDSHHGADHPTRLGPKRLTQLGLISPKTMRLAIVTFVLLCLAIGFILIRDENLFFYGAGLAAILAAVAYTVGPKPYGYRGLGDIFVFIFFGLIGVLGSYYLQTHHLNPAVLLPAVSCGLFCVAVLNVNNIRDIESDQQAGKITIPVRLGFSKARIYHWILLSGGLTFALIYVLLEYRSLWQFLFLITLPAFMKNGFAVSRSRNSAELDPYLKQMAMATFFFSLAFGLGNIL